MVSGSLVGAGVLGDKEGAGVVGDMLGTTDMLYTAVGLAVKVGEWLPPVKEGSWLGTVEGYSLREGSPRLPLLAAARIVKS